MPSCESATDEKGSREREKGKSVYLPPLEQVDVVKFVKFDRKLDDCFQIGHINICQFSTRFLQLISPAYWFDCAVCVMRLFAQ